MSKGVTTPQKKNLMRLVRLAPIARCVTGTLFDDSVQSHQVEKEKGKLVTQAVAETNSNEFK